MKDELQTHWMALVAEITDLGELLAAQPEAVWARPTRLPGWDVRILVAHLARGARRIAEYGATPLTEPPVCDRLSYWHYDPVDFGAGIDARARATAEGQSPASLQAALAAVVESCAPIVETLSADTVIPSAMGPITLGEYLPTRVLEVCVHGLDLRAALDAPPRPTPAALALTCALLDTLLAGPRPADLTDPVAFVEAATGRRPHPDPRLPLLG